MAGVYADRIGDMPDARVTGVASPNSAPSFVAEHVPHATDYGDAAALCDAADVDAVSVLSPTPHHVEAVECAAEAGVDVLCEKPLARTLAGADRIADAVADAGITLMPAHVVRFFPQYATAKERVDDGGVGTPGVARARRAFGVGGDRGWFDDPERSGGVLLDLAIHDFDYLRWVFGPVDRVFARRTEWQGDGRGEVGLTVLRFANGVVGHVEAATVTTTSLPFTTSFEIAGDEGLIEYDDDDTRPFVQYGQERVQAPRDPVGEDLPLRRDGYRRQLDRFVGCLEAGDAPPVGVEAGRAAMRVSLAALESAERGEPVAPAEVEP
jgi:UDP-N-acetylglucosamine 3-dehydrogenase